MGYCYTHGQRPLMQVTLLSSGAGGELVKLKLICGSGAPPGTVRRVALLREAQGDAAEARALWTEARALYEELGLTEGVDEADTRLAALAEGER